MTTPPTPPRDLSEHDRAGIAGTIHECPTPRPSSGYAPSWLNSGRRAGKKRRDASTAATALCPTCDRRRKPTPQRCALS
jgi:hypothetical protein